MRKRITREELERLQQIRGEAAGLKRRLDELEDEALHVVGYDAEGEGDEWDQFVDAMTDFLFNEGTISELLLSLDVAVEGDDETLPI